jgi:LPS-assembly protein
MFKRALLIFLIMSLELYSKEIFTLLAKSVKANGERVEAVGDVVIYSKKSSFRADRALYNKRTKELELFGDVYVGFENSDFTRLNYTKINLSTKDFRTEEPFIYDQESEIWFRTLNMEAKENILTLKKSTISSCNREDPDWRIEFKKGLYNREKEYVSLYSPTFYAGNLPILYLPWFGFPTNRDRKSGFLKPIIGFESQENIFLVQPYYIAIKRNWDIEIDPQIRIGRGYGLYSSFRFVDSNHSYGEVNIGAFKDKRSYREKHDLKNSTHYGINLRYLNNSVLSKNHDYLEKNSYEDGLLSDITYLNDIDFINLDHKTKRASSKLITSKINYVLFNDINYLGVYNKYFIDTEKSSNLDTLQTLPSIQYHKFSNIFQIPSLLYSFDYKFKNNFRRVGLNATQHEFSLPITFYKTVFDEYLNFQVSENLYFSKVNYSNEDLNSSDANYFSNYHRFQLSSDLTKNYNNFIHNIQIDTSFVLPSHEKKSGYFADFIPFNVETKNIAFKLNQYFYDRDGFNFLSHRFRQVFYDDDKLYKYGDLENQLTYYPNRDIRLTNTFFFSHEFHRLSKLQTGIKFNKKRYNFNINHTYEYKKDDKDTNFIVAKVDMRVDANYDLFAGFDYDIEDSFTKEWSFGWRMKKRCWDYQFRYKESVTPNLTSVGAESVVKRGVLFFVRFHPFGGMEYEYNRESTLEFGN